MLRRRAVPGGGAATQAPAAAAAEREGTALTAESIWVVPSAKAAAEAGEGAAGGRQAAEGAQTAEEEPAPPAARPELSPWAEEALSRRRCAQLAESAGLAPSGAPLCAALADICTSGRCDAVAVVYHPSGRREPVELARPEES
ncbi:unnamed protein product [Prorocentrum cordatum]|uniref:Uncharacterized protein n=1 Tax=Prorocentrum cordatum TaxID=2364126 RepID=A0ABN9TTM6_9DINO|nr:unnamed protein product [Polarella glacialis]